MFVLPIHNDLDADNRPWDVIGLIALNSAILIATYAFGDPQQVFFAVRICSRTSSPSYIIHFNVPPCRFLAFGRQLVVPVDVW
jgi:hypothetical protein